MKITEEQLEQLNNGELTIDQLNEDIQKETAKAYNNGLTKKEQELAEEQARILAEKKKQEEQTQVKENNLMQTSKELEEARKLNEETNKQVEQLRNAQLVNDFKLKASGKLTDEQIDNFINITSAEKLTDINLESFARFDVPNIGQNNTPKSPENERQSIKEKMLNLARGR